MRTATRTFESGILGAGERGSQKLPLGRCLKKNTKRSLPKFLASRDGGRKRGGVEIQVKDEVHQDERAAEKQRTWGVILEWCMC